MWTDRLVVLDDVTPAEWLAARLGGSFGAAARTVPRGFAAYARILHPAQDEDARPVRWSTVAERSGRRVHATAQWHCVAGTDDQLTRIGGRPPVVEPPCGNLPLAPLGALCDLLADHTRTADACYFCLWEGWGQLWGGSSRVRFDSSSGFALAEPVPPVMTAEELRAPRVCLPGRDYLLLRGPLTATADLARYDGDLPWTQSPNLFWPADRAWCVATEVDFDSTLVGGSAELIAAVLRSPELEAWPIRPDDSLASDADVINRG